MSGWPFSGFSGSSSSSSSAAAGSGDGIATETIPVGSSSSSSTSPAMAEEEAFAPEDYAESLIRDVKIVSDVFGFEGSTIVLLPAMLRSRYNGFVKNNPSSDDPYWTTAGGKMEKAYWETGRGKDLLKTIQDPRTLLSGLTDLVQTVASPEVVACIKEKHTTIRDFFERTDAKKQCAATVKPDNSKVCWICGTSLNIADKGGNWDSPECEHIFPIAQALCFTGLYDTKLYDRLVDVQNKKDSEASALNVKPQEYIDTVSYEYMWAHRICNQVKNASHFIVYDEIQGFLIAEELASAFLITLAQNENEWGSGKAMLSRVQTELNLTPDKWLVARAKEITARCDKIIQLCRNMGLTPTQHLHSSIMSIQSYIATSECAGTRVVVPASTPSPASPVSYEKLHATFDQARAVRDAIVENFFTRELLEDVLGVVLGVMKTHRREINLPNNFRERLSVFFYNVTRDSTNASKFAAAKAGILRNDELLEAIRLNTLKFVLDANVPIENQWSRFQALFIQFGIATVYLITVNYLDKILVPYGIDEYIKERGDLRSLLVPIESQYDFVRRELWDYYSKRVIGIELLVKELRGPANVKLTNVLDPEYAKGFKSFPAWYIPKTQAQPPTDPQEKAYINAVIQSTETPRRQSQRLVEELLKRNANAINKYTAARGDNIDMRQLRRSTKIGIDLYNAGRFSDAAFEARWVADALRKLPAIGGRRTYRKPKRATSSLRTRRGRHSDLSKLLKKRSSRKSRTGKLMKRTRY